ncbi:MAG TPA: glycoside hydrolase family 57 protein [Cyclobacteriaceae bacterium]|nr:glycoside hydrolase family 57 protein [Cyclobacteriaceae bacterium]
MSSLQRINPMRSLNLYFQVHQPRRLRGLSFFDIGKNETYFDDALNERIICEVARRCYWPANLLLLKLIQRYPQVRITFSISGSALEQLEKFCPAVLESFRMLASTKSVEFLGETYYHSLCSLVDPLEFADQVTKHSDAIERLFGVKPTVFRNTELIYSDHLGELVQQLGFKGVYLDGIQKILRQRSPNRLYAHPYAGDLKLLLRNYRLSDDIAFRFSDMSWEEHPLTVSKFLYWIEQYPSHDQLINLGMDYETFGEHQKSETGVLRFLDDLLTAIARHKKIEMVTASEAIQRLATEECISVPTHISWADRERNLSAWLGNDMQRDAFRSMNKLKKDVIDTGRPSLLNTWRHLQTSDHFYYMSTKKHDDGKVHEYFSHYSSPYEAFMNYMNAIADLEHKILKAQKPLEKNQPSQHVVKEISAMNNIVEKFSHLI